QDLQQRRLARTVGADDADAVAAQHGGGHIVQQHAAIVGLGHVPRLDDALARVARAGHLHLHVAGQLAPLRALAAHGLERGHAALVAGAARLDALPDPDLFLRQQFVEARVFLRLGVQALFAPAQVVFVVARPAAESAAVDLDDTGGQRTQEAAVVGDEHDAAAELLEEAFAPGEALDVVVAGWLVRQPDVGVAHQRLPQQHAALHAARERGKVGLLGQLQPVEDLLHAAVQVPAVLRLDFRLGLAHGLHVAFVQRVVVTREHAA